MGLVLIKSCNWMEHSSQSFYNTSFHLYATKSTVCLFHIVRYRVQLLIASSRQSLLVTLSVQAIHYIRLRNHSSTAFKSFLILLFTFQKSLPNSKNRFSVTFQQSLSGIHWKAHITKYTFHFLKCSFCLGFSAFTFLPHIFNLIQFSHPHPHQWVYLTFFC